MDVLDGADMVFITAGMGGGTGTGAAPVVAQVAREMGILTVAVVTKPFSFEGRKRAEVANNGIRELSQYVDSLITVPNDRLVDVLGSEVSLVNAFEAADDVLLGAVQGIAQVITCQGLINVDFADVKTVMGEMGMAMMGSGKAQGEDRARVATEAAISSPLLEHIDLVGAKGILANITAGMDFGIGEFNEVGNIIKAVAADEATVVIGTVLNPELSGEIWVTIVATGLSQPGDQLSRPQLVTTNEPGAESTDYDKLDRPAVLRNKAVNDDIYPVKDDPDYLEIPAFLRRQAD
jgi:cell division protein FtsZ